MSPPANESRPVVPGRLRVLVAEDEPVSRVSLARTIQRLGHEVLVAKDGVEAWQLFADAGADVVVTDWMMPGLDGPELCRRIRADIRAAYTYVIFSTALKGQDNVRDALSAGADDYLVKPILPEDIEARLIVAQRVMGLHRERAQELAHRETLLQMARQFALEADPERILSAALAQSMRLLNADGALLYRWDETNRGLASVRNTLWDSEESLVVDLGCGAAGRAAAERGTIWIADYEKEANPVTALVAAGVRSALAVPLLHEGRLLGALEVASRDGERIFSLSEGETLELLAANISTALIAIEHTRALQALADTGPLTQLANRRRATDVLRRYLNVARRRGHRVSIAVIDLDHFKDVNDSHGHPAGDAVLVGVSNLLAQIFRGEDVVARWGGDEFVVGMYDVPRETAVSRLRQVLEALRKETFTSTNGRAFSVTFSAGLAEYPADGGDLLELYGSADAALYEAKNAGRDCVLETDGAAEPLAS